MKEENLIFIISQPRSGSTYLQNLLSNNKEVNTCSESWLLLNFANQLKPSLVSASFNNKLAVEAFDLYKAKYPDYDFNKAQKDFILKNYEPLLNGFDFVIDKTPRYWELLDEILEYFPNSKIIILKRNPKDVVSSMVRTWGLNNLKKLNSMRRDILFAPKVINTFLKKHRKNSAVYELKYEDVIFNTEIEIEKLYNWIGIKYTDDVLNTNKNKKYKGKFGDPFQNSEFEKEKRERIKRDEALTAFIERFNEGYESYLTSEFLLEYGGYELEHKIDVVKNNLFSNFLTSELSNLNMLDKIKKIIVNSMRIF